MYSLDWCLYPSNYYNSYRCDYTYNERTGFVISNNSLNKSFSELRSDVTKEIIRLKKPINFLIEYDENGFYYSNDEFNIYSFGKTQKEAENNLVSEFMIQYNSYALEKNNNLDEKALELKNKLLAVYGGKLDA